MRSTSPATTSDSRWRRAAGFLFPTRSQLWLRTNPTGWVAWTALPLMVASEFSLRRRSQNAALSGAADSAVVVELVVYLAVAAFLVLSLVQPPNGRRIPALLLVMWGFTLAMLLAAFWSPFPLLATARGAQLVVAASLGHLVARYATANALSRLCHAYLIVVAVSVGIGLALPFPPLPQAGGRFTWLYVHPNVSGTFLAIAVAIALALLLRRRAGVVGAPWGSSLYAFVLAVDVGALLATRSRGSLVA
nr:hypothetical protein [Acidimicrobiia bacterium]